MGLIPTRLNVMGSSHASSPQPTGYWGLSFTAEQANSTIQLVNVRSADAIYLDVSFDDGVTWEPYTIGDTITLSHIGDNVCFAAREGYINQYTSGNTENRHSFSMTGLIAAHGSIESLRCNNESDMQQMTNYCYARLFINCSSLTSPPTLPATTLNSHCYYGMFSGCTSLTTTPELPATTLGENCYFSMFSECTSLTTTPELPATTLSSNCYRSMFSGCTSLTTTPELPATTLSSSCYRSMFSGCTSLTTAPKLPATKLVGYCYDSMFSGCTSLTTAPKLPATTLIAYCYRSMFSGCTSLTTAPTTLPATKLVTYCYESMFSGCSSLLDAPSISATSGSYTNCLSSMFLNCSQLRSITVSLTSWPTEARIRNWVRGVSSSGTFKCPSSLGDNSTIERGVNRCPSGWTVVNT